MLVMDPDRLELSKIDGNLKERISQIYVDKDFGAVEGNFERLKWIEFWHLVFLEVKLECRAKSISKYWYVSMEFGWVWAAAE